LHVLVEWAGRAAFGLAGVAAGMAVTTAAVLAALLWPLGTLTQALRGVGKAALLCGALALLTFGVSRIVIDAPFNALIGLALYAGVLTYWRPAGLRDAWAYARMLR
jgi:hypothetical protein